MRAPALLRERGLVLRWLRGGDLPWLRELYATTRADEMAPVPWPAAQKRHFLDQQFALQHDHFVRHFGEADFLAIEQPEGRPIGRYYVGRGETFHVVDIALTPACYRQGIGTALITHTLAEAADGGRNVLLHVNKFNDRAMKLYSRLGFAVSEDTGSHWQMRWSPTGPGHAT
jgi:ribosomal protein S18 acetylase RimI-like enzyme